MIKLLINSSGRAEMSETSFGGKPVKNIGEDFHWPKCSCCKLPMQFLAKLRIDEELHQIFMCQNDPGMCDDWDANGGGNTVVVIKPFELEFVQELSEGETLRETEHSAKVVSVDGNDYEAARSEWAEKNGISPREVLDQISGEPSWIQGDETPNCTVCNKPMEFVAQLEQGPDWKTEMNFGGGGVAYSFRCTCNGSAKFLWQC
ncbi:hypothetical protein HUF18_02275 [Thalassolituus sp. ST750PaO-4]|uniref:hypothetical protein n=1 Tax=Thalassolituus sp. ST750PaO-4 TaxID=2742965 RepID=UPI001CE2ACAB|nr:hypothetical protein [Thalassolituus sp. ST750PaO-4]MCA6058588.1 hypothetical protein [Thalassolituus sp. ST750PaO-4]